MAHTPKRAGLRRDPALDRILRQAPGTTTRLAEACGITRSAVAQWRSVPQRHLRTVARVARVPIDSLIPRARKAERERKTGRKGAR